MPGCLREAREVGFSNAAVESHAHFTLHVESRKSWLKSRSVL